MSKIFLIICKASNVHCDGTYHSKRAVNGLAALSLLARLALVKVTAMKIGNPRPTKSKTKIACMSM